MGGRFFSNRQTINEFDKTLWRFWYLCVRRESSALECTNGFKQPVVLSVLPGNGYVLGAKRLRTLSGVSSMPLKGAVRRR